MKRSYVILIENAVSEIKNGIIKFVAIFEILRSKYLRKTTIYANYII